MKDPDPASALRVDLGALAGSDRPAYDAAAKTQTAKSAGTDQQFAAKKPTVEALWSASGAGSITTLSSVFLGQREIGFHDAMAKKGKKGFALPEFPHDYLLLEGEFGVKGGAKGCEVEVVMPRIKFVFRRRAKGGGGEVDALKAEIAALKVQLSAGVSGGGSDVAAAEPIEAVALLDADVEAKVMALTLTLDDEPLTITGCYKLQPSRAARYGAVADQEGEVLFPQLAAGGGIAVTCTNDEGEVVETVLSNDLEHCVIEDPIMFSEVALPALVEAQFDVNGAWTAGSAGVDTLEMERANNFALYEENISNDAKGPPACMSALRRMLQGGPVCTVYARGTGFTLRMPAADLEAFQTINEEGKITNLPRPAVAVRVWDGAARAYKSVEEKLTGAPVGPDAADAWYVDVIKRMKANMYLGSKNVDELALSTQHEYNAAHDLVFTGNFSNHWTDLVVATPSESSGC